MICLQKFFKSSSSTKTWKRNYIPKDATQQDIFLSKYPTFDGRGIKIAIIDSGFDVSLDGFQQTSEGLPKIIDCFDFTGNGDVDTAEIRKVENNNILIGLSGRKLKIPKKWINPSGKWHLGLKSLYKPTMSKKISDICEKLPEIDCIVWFDGNKWCACIETYGTNLEKSKVLTNFRDQHEYGILRMKGLEMTYCITVHNNGNLLEILMAYDHHGSFVAQIAAAHYPGLAPGAQMIFMSVLSPTDQKLKNMHPLKKALLKCIEMKVDIINYSLSSFFWDDEITQIIRVMTNLHNILFFKGAGNSGPFYATTTTCKNMENLIFIIGAALTPQMKKRLYNVSNDDKCPPALYPFSSRGPGASTSQGLDFVAPGAAITRTPRFVPKKYLAFYGTSCSSPNAAGAVACLLSGLKVHKIKYSPKSIKFVLFKTANLPNERNKFEFGHGIIQIYDAFEYYCKNANIDFNSKIPIQLLEAGGIFFMQNDDEKDTVMEREIDLSKFLQILTGAAVAKKWILEISPISAQSFIELLSTIDENSLFKIKVNTTNLEPGSLNFAEILVIDPFIGSIYSIPVNVIYVLKITDTHNYRFKKEIILNYENPYHLTFRAFFDGKNICDKCNLKITALKSLKTKLSLQYYFQNDANFEEAKASKKILKFTKKNPIQIFSFPFENKKLQQICIHQGIGGLSNAKFKLEFSFECDKFVRLYNF